MAQRRAADSLARLGELSDRSEDLRKLYRSYVDRLGPAIVMNGLGQAVATERAAGSERASDREKAHHELYVSLQRWLCRDGGVYAASSDLLSAIMDNDESYYLRAQAEALAWLEWHKKLCRAAFPKGGEDAE